MAVRAASRVLRSHTWTARCQPRLGLHEASWPAGAARCIRTGFFQEDDDYIDPEDPLFAQALDAKWRHMDDASLQAPVLERSNVGMGMIVLNRPDGLDLEAVNSAYVSLRNLEVNSLKRFVGLTARGIGTFCMGVNPRELLLLGARSAQKGWRLPQFGRALLWHQQELAHLVGTYHKPIVCQISGQAANGGAALACLASFSGAYTESEIVVDACARGLVPDGGMTHVLGGLQWHLGQFLALTGWRVRGADLVYSGLVKHWLSPEALPFLELTAEKQLEVSEADAKALLDEHSLALPEWSHEGDAMVDGEIRPEMIPLINRVFSQGSVPAILRELKNISGSTADGKFAEECVRRIERACPLALCATHELVARAARRRRADGAQLVETLTEELRVQARLLCSRDALVGLHAHCLGLEVRGKWTHGSTGELVSADVDALFQPRNPQSDDMDDFAVHRRSEVSLSSHPRLRRYHPDYNDETGLDHDPDWMQAEVRRWSPDLYKDQRKRAIDDLAGAGGSSMFSGYDRDSRWVRVDPIV